ncbi:MAG: hypothetical protein ACNFW9_03800 [Candidatus Kerfeldbacteria bacterium]
MVKLFFMLGSMLILGWAALHTGHFKSYVNSAPYAMGFIKLFFLGTLGELIKYRISKKTWKLDYILERAIFWGLFGIWFTNAFPFFAGGTGAIITKGLWWDNFQALSSSLWINIFGGYALYMMIIHEYCNHLIKTRYHGWRLSNFAKNVDRHFIFCFLPMTLIFWVCAHTITFSLPPDLQILSAAVLAIALGIFLSVGRRIKTA